MARAAQRKAPETDKLRRNLSFQPQTIDEEARTFWQLRQRNACQALYGDEVLLVSSETILPPRLPGMAVLDSHNRSSVLNHLGRVIEWKIVNRELLVKIELAQGERGQHALISSRAGFFTRSLLATEFTNLKRQTRGTARRF